MTCNKCPFSLLCHMEYLEFTPRIVGHNYVFLCSSCGRLIYTYWNQHEELVVYTFFCQKRCVSSVLKEIIQQTMALFKCTTVKDPVTSGELWLMSCEKCIRGQNLESQVHWIELE